MQGDPKQGMSPAPQDVGQVFEIDTNDLRQDTSKEVESLNRLLQMLAMEDEEEEEIEIRNEGNPTKDDLLKLLQAYQNRLVKKTSGKGLLLVGFNDAKQRLRRVQLDKSIKDDALQKLMEQKESLLKALMDEVDDLRKDIEELEDALKAAYGYVESKIVKVQEPKGNRITVKWNPSIPEHDALHRIFKEDNIPLLDDSDEIDYSKVKKKAFTGAPVLDLDVSK
ncbi:hypothetical protein BGZ54_005574, partial [Gamsiella multidivaricata]